MSTDKRGMTRRGFLGAAGLGAAALAADVAEKAMRPNILIIFVDDMGYSDPGCFGGEIPTPNLDHLAARGVRFTQFYNAARCCPARAALLTGLYPHQAGIGMMVYRDCGEGYRGNLNDRCVTFGEVLGAAGYQTMLVGKWHCGHRPHSRPEVRGFQHFTGIYPHIDSYWKVLRGCDIYRDGRLFIPAGENPKNPYRPDEEFYTTDFFTDVALDYLDEALGDRSRPFLLHLCYNVPHFPLEAPDDLIEHFRGRYAKGWDRLREEKLERMKAMGIVGPKQKLPRVRGFARRKWDRLIFKRAAPTGYLPAWGDLDEGARAELDFRRAIYAAQIARLDQNVGRIVERLTERGALDNTLILFFSDNGCSGELGPFGMNWGRYTSKNYKTWRKKGGWSISQGQCWASLSNTPLRKFKIFVHEGGIASPCIVHWPGGIARPGRLVTNQAFHLIDIMPTLCEVAGAKYPTTFEGRDIIPAQGISMVPWFRNPDAPARPRTLYWQHETNAAIREGDWKLVTTLDRDQRAWELYNLAEDRSESDDLASRKPELVERLKKKWLRWAEDARVVPFPEQRGRPKPIPLPAPPKPRKKD